MNHARTCRGKTFASTILNQLRQPAITPLGETRDFTDIATELVVLLGFAAVFGLDVMITERMFLNGNIRYMDIESDAKITIPGDEDTVLRTNAKIDPWVYAINIGWVL